MARKSTNKPALIGRSHTVPSVKPTFVDLDNLDWVQLCEYARQNAGVDHPKLTREPPLRFVRVLKRIRHPDDGIPSPVRQPSPSPTPPSVSRLAAANDITSVVQPPIGEATGPISSALPEYPAGRANILDTCRSSSPVENEEDNTKDYLVLEGFNRAAPNSTPEPDEHPVQTPPADIESLAHMAKMLHAFRKRYEDLAKYIKEVTNTTQALKRTAAGLMQPMERYLNYYMQEQPIFAHEVALPPNEPVFVINVDEEQHRISDEVDATEEDQEEDFAIFKAEKMLQHVAQKGKKPDPKYYNHDNANDKLEPNKAFYWSETSRGLSEAEKESFARSRFISGDPETRRRLYAAYPDLKPKNLKRPASFRDESSVQGTHKRPRLLICQRTICGDEMKSTSTEGELAPQPELGSEGSCTSPSAPGTAQGNFEIPGFSLMSPAHIESGVRCHQVSYSALLVCPPQHYPSQENGVALSASRPRRSLRRHESLLDGKPQ